MTLTGSLAAAEPRERLQTQLTALFRPLLAEPVPVREVCLYSQTDSSKAFVLVERFPLGPEAAEGKAAEGQTSRTEEHTSELPSLMRITNAVLCMKKK